MKYIILDTETTGIEKNDRIIQLAFLIIDSKNNIEIKETLCKPEQPINFHAMAVHHITPEMIENAAPLTETKEYKKLLELNSPENYIIIQNSKFDLNMLEKEGFINKMKIIDTLILAKHLIPTSESHSEQYLRYSLGLYKKEKELQNNLGIKNIKAHDAVGDIIVLWILFNYIKNIGNINEKISKIIIFESELKNMTLTKNDFFDLDINDQLFLISQIPILVTTFNFGKYKNRAVSSIIRNDPSYINWILNKFENLTPEFRFSIEYFLYPNKSSEVEYKLP